MPPFLVRLSSLCILGAGLNLVLNCFKYMSVFSHVPHVCQVPVDDRGLHMYAKCL